MQYLPDAEGIIYHCRRVLPAVCINFCIPSSGTFGALRAAGREELAAGEAGRRVLLAANAALTETQKRAEAEARAQAAAAADTGGAA